MVGRRARYSQRGAALLVFLILVVTAALTYLVNSLTPEMVEARRAQKTSAALAQARDALIGYALTYRERRAAQDANLTGDDDSAMYGFLPMPDVGTSRFNTGQQNPACNTEGCAMDFVNGAFPSTTETVIGRLPWRTLGTGPLLDGNGECLWYLVSAGHKSLGIDANALMNWDTPGQIDIVTANDTANLQSLITNAHDRPVAIVFSPGPPLGSQTRGQIGSDVVTECRGNYTPANYLEPSLAATILDNDPVSTSTYFSGVIPTDTSSNSLLAISTQGKILKDGTNLKKACPAGTNCSLVANDAGLPLTSDILFGAIRKNKYFRNDIKEMLKRMAKCWSSNSNIASLTPIPITDYTQPADKIAGRIPDAPAACNNFLDTAYGNDRDPRGYFNHYRDMIFIARPASGSFTVNGDSTCKGVLVFSGPRSAGKKRVTADDKKTLSNYLEGDNLASFMNAGATFSGDSPLDDAPPQADGKDIAVCIPPPPVNPALVESSTLATLNVGQLVAYDASTRTLTLGKENVVTGNTDIGAGNAAALFGCAWMEDNVKLGNGARIYFTFQFKKVGTSVGSNGFIFTLADAAFNGTDSCGAAGSHLGYSGDNGSTPKITFPKIGIEFDQGHNGGFTENLTNPGRHDPCGTLTCTDEPGPTPRPGYSSHAAILYWGNEQNNIADLVARPDNDDNVHGFPAVPSILRPPPTNPAYDSAGLKFINMRGYPNNDYDGRLFHVRIEITPIRNIASAAESNSTSVQTQAWILADSTTDANQIAAMQNTTRPMSDLYPSFNPTLLDTAVLYDVATVSSCDAGNPCASGEACGTEDNICYRPALKYMQVGFTGSQRTSDQEVSVNYVPATWIP